uniref:hypothetical protein n=1 Tax=Rhodococcus sp. CH91 TaxID=2910256 RepID=UPI0035A9565E
NAIYHAELILKRSVSAVTWGEAVHRTQLVGESLHGRRQTVVRRHRVQSLGVAAVGRKSLGTQDRRERRVDR